MSAPASTACTYQGCGRPGRRYQSGMRCPDHTPAAMAGQPEPDELLRRHRAALATATEENR